MSTQIIQPLRETFQSHHSQLLGVLSMAELLLKFGAIQSLRAFEDYLIHTGLVRQLSCAHLHTLRC